MAEAITHCRDNWLATRHLPASHTPAENLEEQSSTAQGGIDISVPRPAPSNRQRVAYAFHLIRSRNTVSTLSLDEMEDIVNRALDKEFDDGIQKHGK
jgi:hypothetical protein